MPAFSLLTGSALRRKVLQCHLMSLARVTSQARTSVLGTDIKCRLYSNNSTADFAISTAATTLLYSAMKTHVTRRQAFKSSSEKQAGIKKQYFAWTAQQAERRSSLNRTPFCYTSDSQPGVRTRTFRGSFIQYSV